MKNIIKAMSLLLLFCMLFSMVACGQIPVDTAQNTEADTTANADQTPTDKYAAIAGEYLLDASELGMPMKWYIKVTADGKFQISTTRDYATLKGEGTVGDKDGTYMLVYADSTAEAPKSATFKFEGKNMVFSTNVPIGAASVSPKEDKYPTAKLIANEDILGTYLGSYAMEAMGSSIVYNFSLDLVIGNEYNFTSTVVMGTNTLTLTETGAFEVNGTEITFTPAMVNDVAVENAEAVKGSITDKTVKAAFKLSTMAKARQEIEAKFAVYADVAGTYTGLYKKAMGPTMTLEYKTIMVLDAFGGYKYSTVDVADETKVNYTEEGTYTYANGKFAFTSNKEGAAAVEGTLANYVLATKLPINAIMSTPVDVSFYAPEVSGLFSASVEEGGKKYGASISLLGNVCAIAVANENAEIIYVATGTIEVKKAMLTTLEFKCDAVYKDAAMQDKVAEIPAELKTVSAPVAASGINAELPFDLDDSKLIGFQFTKAQ